jgi:hypothetical protein
LMICLEENATCVAAETNCVSFPRRSKLETVKD